MSDAFTTDDVQEQFVTGAMIAETILKALVFTNENSKAWADGLARDIAAVLDLDTVRAEAWEKGFDACEVDTYHHLEQGWGAKCIKAAENPYRRAEQ